MDEEARLLHKKGKSVAGYNVQIAVDEKHKLLIACEVTDQLAIAIHQAQLNEKLATTNANLDFIGREEGIAAMAVTCVDLPH